VENCFSSQWNRWVAIDIHLDQLYPNMWFIGNIEEICDSLGRMIDIDECFKVSAYQTMSKILVEVITGERLNQIEEIVIHNIIHRLTRLLQNSL
jgi:hypothetical protein